MKSDIVLPLTPVNHYSRLPDGKSIHQFQQYLSAQAQKLYPPQKIQSFKTFFVAAKNLNDAYLIACFCFGGLAFLQQLKQKGISQQVLDQMGKKMSQFSWATDKNGFELFEYNSKKFGSIYPFYYQKIFKVLDKNEKNCKQLFQWVKNNKSQYLYGLKIRKWINKQQIKNYRQLQKQNQQVEVDRVNGNSYLIFAKTSTQAYNLGVIFEEIEFQSQRRNTSNTNLSDSIKYANFNASNVNNTNFHPNKNDSKTTALEDVRLQVQGPLNKQLEPVKLKKNELQNRNNILRTPSNEFSKIKSIPKNNLQQNLQPIGNKNINNEKPNELSSIKVNLLNKQFYQNKQEKKPWWKRYICCCLYKSS